MNNFNQPAQCRGLTVVEIMVTLAILAILLSVGVPSYSTMLEKNRIGEASGMLHTTFHLARSEAVKRRRAVQVCPTVDGNACRNDGDWSGGWISFTDLNGNATPDAGELIQHVDLPGGGLEIGVPTAFTDFVRFQPTGMLTGSGGISGGFQICHAGMTYYSHELGLSPAGQVRLRQHTPAQCPAG